MPILVNDMLDTINIDRAQLAALTVVDPETGAKRADKGKLRYDLLPPKVIEDLVRVLTLGAKKYTETHTLDYNYVLTLLQEKLEQCQIVLNVKRNPTLEECVEIVMTDSSKTEIQNMLSDRDRTVVNGIESIQNTIENSKLKEEQIQTFLSKRNEERSKQDLKATEPAKKNWSYFYKSRKISAEFAKEILPKLLPHTLIMTIKQNGQEDTCVVVATTVSDSLMTVLTALKELLPTLNPHPLTKCSINQNKDGRFTVSISGDSNWRQGGGMAWTRCYASLMRHIQAWYQGEDTDPETGESHLSHALCNLVFLSEYSRTNQVKDDRPFKR